MFRPPVTVHVSLRHDAWIRVEVNDLPLTRGIEKAPTSMNKGINELLVPGENEIVVEILRAPPSPYLEDPDVVDTLPHGGEDPSRKREEPEREKKDPRITDWKKTSLDLKVFKRRDFHQPDKGLEILHECRYPDIWDDVPEGQRRLPHRHVATFSPGIDVHPMAHLDAPRVEVDCAGTPALRDAVAEVHDALVSRDADRMVRLLALQMQQLERAYEGVGFTVAELSADWPDFFGEPTVVEPLEPERLHFRGRAGGRVVEVRRDDGKPVLSAHRRDEPERRIRTDVFLTRLNDRWRVLL